MDEFKLIQYICEQQDKIQLKHNNKNKINIPIGDDAASISIPNDSECIISTDTLNSGIHFFADSEACDIAHKALAVNLSDLSAMGATPAWYTLNLTIPSLNQSWIKSFCNGLFKLAKKYNTTLIGGDITKGPLSITITAIGHTPNNQAIKRSGAKPGDFIYISDTIGESGYILDQIYNKKYTQDNYKNLLKKLNSPNPQVVLGEKLRNIASSCIDISDGLAADLSHILNKSNVSATLYQDKIPISNILKQIPKKEALTHILYGGDDYQLCFTSPADYVNKIQDLEEYLNQKIYKIGEICEIVNINNPSNQPEIFLNTNKNINKINTQGFKHF